MQAWADVRRLVSHARDACAPSRVARALLPASRVRSSLHVARELVTRVTVAAHVLRALRDRPWLPDDPRAGSPPTPPTCAGVSASSARTSRGPPDIPFVSPCVRWHAGYTDWRARYPRTPTRNASLVACRSRIEASTTRPSPHLQRPSLTRGSPFRPDRLFETSRSRSSRSPSSPAEATTTTTSPPRPRRTFSRPSMTRSRPRSRPASRWWFDIRATGRGRARRAHPT